MIIGNQDRVNEINHRIYYRNVPRANPRMSLGIRPVSTKYDYKPIFDRPLDNNVPIETKPFFKTNEQYLPGDSAPWDGFATHVNTESKLKNMGFALTKANQGIYIPSSNSDLYQTRKVSVKNKVNQPHPHLFTPNTFNTNQEPPPFGEQQNIFYNDTRQMRLNL